MLDLLFIKQIKLAIKGNYSPIINYSSKTIILERKCMRKVIIYNKIKKKE